MSKFNSSNNSFQEKYDEMMFHINRASALVNVAVAARLSDLDDATIFNYFHLLSDTMEHVKKSCQISVS